MQCCSPPTAAVTTKVDSHDPLQSRKLHWQERNSLMQQETPYGPLAKHITAPTDDEGPDIQIKIICPFAWLYTAAHVSATYCGFLRNWLAGNICQVVLYEDECTPGNIRRFDKGRKYIAIYWSVLDFPHWFRTRHIGWIPLCFIQTKRLKKYRVAPQPSCPACWNTCVAPSLIVSTCTAVVCW